MKKGECTIDNENCLKKKAKQFQNCYSKRKEKTYYSLGLFKPEDFVVLKIVFSSSDTSIARLTRLTRWLEERKGEYSRE